MMNSLLKQGYDSQDKSQFEKWKPIPGYEGIYEASNQGRIRTSEGKTTSNARYSIRHWKQRVLKPKFAAANRYRGDLKVTLWKNGKRQDYLVARLVAKTWVPGYADGLTVNHIDGDYLNNRAENLEWITLADNIRIGFKLGLYKAVQNGIRLYDENYQYVDFNSMAEASRYLGRNNGYVSNTLKKSRFVKSKDGETFIAEIKGA